MENLYLLKILNPCRKLNFSENTFDKITDSAEKWLSRKYFKNFLTVANLKLFLDICFRGSLLVVEFIFALFLHNSACSISRESKCNMFFFSFFFYIRYFFITSNFVQNSFRKIRLYVKRNGTFFSNNEFHKNNVLKDSRGMGHRIFHPHY